ncbi:tyrosine-type recombinase/integrase [Microbacterium enclense]|uniref:tyrosine-type recombinase/integrase n=1 Tax=Microbacterium enclense TaxID=993073 RepID=UPI0036DB1E40
MKAQLRHEMGIETPAPEPKRLAETPRGHVKFQKFAEDLLAARKPALARSTHHMYLWLLSKHLVPAFGHRRLIDISPGMVRAWFASMPDNIARRNAYSLLGATLRQAVDDGEIDRSPARIRGGAKDTSKPRPTFHKADVSMLLMMNTDRQLGMMITLLHGTGMRAGELLGLNRGDIDLDNSTVTVSRHLTVHGLQKGTKSHPDALRVLTLPQASLDAVRAHLSTTQGEFDDPLCRDARGGRMSYHTLNRHWVRLRASVGLDDLNLHDLRHLHLTEYARFASLKDVQARAGQTDVRSTLRYLHTSLDRDREIIAAMEAAQQ